MELWCIVRQQKRLWRWHNIAVVTIGYDRHSMRLACDQFNRRLDTYGINTRFVVMAWLESVKRKIPNA